MKLSISNIAWQKEDDEIMYDFLKKSNFSGLEIAPTRIFEIEPYSNLENAKSFKDSLLKKYNLEISSIQSICFGRNEAIFGHESERTLIKNYLKLAINFANSIGCKNLVFGCPKNRNIGDNQEVIAKTFFSELAQYSSTNNTNLAVEANPEIYGTNFLNTTNQAIEFVKEINQEGLKINLDLGTIIHNNEDLDIIFNNIDLINHIHLSEPYLESIQERPIHLELAKILKKTNYQSYVSIEMKNLNDFKNLKEVINYTKSLFNVL
jgi:sugar phosphate isomerase/epimerase